MKKLLTLLILVCILSSVSYGNKVISLPYIINDIAYSKVHDKLFAIVDALDTEYGNRLIEINISTGKVERYLFVGSQPGRIRLTSDENFAWIIFGNIPFIKRIDLTSFEIDKEIYLGPSRQYTSPNHLFSTVLAYNFTVFPNENNKLALGLIQPFISNFEAIVLYRNDSILPQFISENSQCQAHCIEPVLNGDYLVGHSQSSAESIYYTIKVHDNGLEYINRYVNEGELMRNWFKVYNDTLFSAAGTILDATNCPDILVNGTCENDMIGDRYGFAYSKFHNAFMYPHFIKDTLSLKLYNKKNFETEDTIRLFKYPYSRIVLMLELEVIDTNRFAILIGKDYGSFYAHIIEVKETASDTIQENEQPVVFPNPATERININGKPLNKRIFIYDVTGRLLKIYERRGIKAEIELQNFSAGTYLIKVSDIDGEINSVTSKIVLQK